MKPPECVVKREVGTLLKSVQEELALQNLSLKMFDCYRPTRAVADMVAWSRDGKETVAESATIRRSARPTCFGSAISPSASAIPPAPRSIYAGRFESRQFGRVRCRQDYGDCTANVNLRAPDGSVDMGTG